MQDNLCKSWKQLLNDEFNKDYFEQLNTFLDLEYKNESVFPPRQRVFEAFNLCPFEDVKVVIFGQDPYHGEGQAHGLAFSVQNQIKLPPSLKNIFKELKTDLGLEAPEHGNLEKWAKEGVLLLNSVLTVRKSEAGSHRKAGWEKLTDKVVELLNDKDQSIVFILWGRDAQKKGKKINKDKHLVLECAHPSPFSVRKFYGNRHFSKANSFLKAQGLSEIDWDLASK
ncbi:MAG: uracil-DNA glycosylase [Bacteriovoracaceae bacterium]|nr:uracil-DNA glycosylase [Bacteriovoracaceae bacterium]